MIRARRVVGLAVAAALALISAESAVAGTVCVGARPQCSATLPAALDQADDGDTVVIAPGTYAGGVTVERSVHIIGGGASTTVIRGGGPVVTIGTFGAATE